jgi:hypothetical protein
MIFKENIMKKIIGLAALAGMIAIMSGCTKDVTEVPQSAVDISLYYRSTKDISSSLAGMYTSFQEEMTGSGSGGKYNYWGEGRSDNFDRSQYANSTITELAFNGLTINNAATDWAGLYRTIYRANVNLKYFPQVSTYDNLATPAFINNSLAQCYAMRAESYFYIVRLWGDAPIWTEPYLDVSQPASRPREAASKIIDSVIIPDLTKAYSLMQKGQTPTVWNINEGAICAIMADVYMWRAGQPGGGQSDYQNAIAWTQKLFAAKGPTGAVYAGTSGANLEPTATWKNLFLVPTTSIEPIWSIAWDNTLNGCACLPITTQTSNNPVRVDTAIYFKWKKNRLTDTRFGKTIDTTSTTVQGTWLAHMDKVLKYFVTNNNASTILTGTGTTLLATNLNVYLVMYRLGDVYLTYAEALNKTNDPTNAIRYLNYIRVRAGLPAYTAVQLSSTTLIQDAILQERQYELFAEGKRWFDLVRTNNVQKVMDPVVSRRQILFGSLPTGFSDARKILWPLSQSALNANRTLVQNPGY